MGSDKMRNGRHLQAVSWFYTISTVSFRRRPASWATRRIAARSGSDTGEPSSPPHLMPGRDEVELAGSPDEQLALHCRKPAVDKELHAAARAGVRVDADGAGHAWILFERSSPPSI
jgi:hypothetical protein